MARSDLNELLNALLPFAQQMLQKYGEFHPYAAVMKDDGEVVHIAIELDERAASSSDQILEYVRTFQKLESDSHLRAVGIGFDVRTVPPSSTEKTDAICIRLEHRDGEAVDILLPYHKGHDTIQYGQLYATRGPNQVFSDG